MFIFECDKLSKKIKNMFSATKIIYMGPTLYISATTFILLIISSSYAKILGQKLFRTWEFPRSGSKAKDGEKKEKKKRRERLNDGDNNGRATNGARKPPGPKYLTP